MELPPTASGTRKESSLCLMDARVGTCVAPQAELLPENVAIDLAWSRDLVPFGTARVMEHPFAWEESIAAKLLGSRPSSLRRFSYLPRLQSGVELTNRLCRRGANRTKY